ncbi:replication factor c subunit, putative [Ichthyophthirius multifiliis]|uniref:Replication factor c subunit, putative n=1 Tax=Ichthyophthirius multifiliis TaxID=5932 RepID=G0QS49_ICHMU|nr:replication factor c subunit, putative [Ichthyophthirius multifiliis]EGR31962.1 replication factor c subunit, putative [Ichthyophthirius multifiliis]|eukprot:XP_004035448.1 replication factor c subunit, putative [Ichthyophthirius multifiliis]
MDIEVPSKKQIQKKDIENIPWVEKYRPDTLKDLISHEFIVMTITKFINEQNKLPNLLFYGPPGTGKTSTIVAIAKQLYGNSYKQMVLELNASDDRGINVVRDQIKTFAGTANFSAAGKGTKLIILDEADQMTNQAQFALRRIIEKYSNNARFCLICNYVSKIIPALQSRCTRFKFKHIPIEDAQKRIEEICLIEKIKYDQSGLEAIFKLCDGDMRRVVNMLQVKQFQYIYIYYIFQQSLQLQSNILNQVFVNEEFVYKFTGNATPQDMEEILNILLTENLINAYETIRKYQVLKGISLQVILKELNMKLMYSRYPSIALEFLVKRIAELEYRMSISCEEKVQLLSLIGVFIEIRHTINK